MVTKVEGGIVYDFPWLERIFGESALVAFSMKTIDP